MNPNLLKGIGVPWGEMKGVEDSDAEPKVAAREMSLPLPLEEGTVFIVDKVILVICVKTSDAVASLVVH